MSMRLSRARVKSIDAKGGTVGGIEAARKLRKELGRLFASARQLRWIGSNPVDDALGADEVARYTEAANQERLADGAIRRLVEWEKSNRVPALDAKSA